MNDDHKNYHHTNQIFKIIFTEDLHSLGTAQNYRTSQVTITVIYEIFISMVAMRHLAYKLLFSDRLWDPPNFLSNGYRGPTE
jgi:hypothetical protein